MFFAYKYGDQEQLQDRDKMVRNHYATRVWRITGEAMDRVSYATANATADALFDFACMLSAPCDGRDWDLEETDSESSGSDFGSLWEDNALDSPIDDGDATWDPTMPEASTDIERTDGPDLSASAGSNFLTGNYFMGGYDGQAGMPTSDQALSSTQQALSAPVESPDNSDIPSALGNLQVQDSSRFLEDTAEQAIPSGVSQGNENKGTFEHIEDVNDSRMASPAASDEDQGVTEHVEDVGDAETENADVDDDDVDDDELNKDPIQRRRFNLENDVADVEVYWKTFQRLPAKHPDKHEITGKYIYWAYLGAEAAGDFLNGFVSESNKTEPAMPGKVRHQRRRRAFISARTAAPDEAQADQAQAPPPSAQAITARERKAAEDQKIEQFQLARTRLLASRRELATQSIRRVGVDVDEQHTARKATQGAFHGLTQMTQKYLPESPLRKSVSVDDVRSHTTAWW